MKTKLLTAVIVCALLISLTGCVADKTAPTLQHNVNDTVNTEVPAEPVGEMQAVTLTAETAENEMPAQPASTEAPQTSEAPETEPPRESEAPRQTEAPSRPNRQNLRSRMLRVSRRSRKSPWKHSRSRQNLRNHRKKRNSPSQRSLLLRLRRPNPRQPNRLLQQSLPRRLNLLLRSKQSLLLKRSPRPHTIMNSTSMRSEPTASPSVRAYA